MVSLKYAVSSMPSKAATRAAIEVSYAAANGLGANEKQKSTARMGYRYCGLSVERLTEMCCPYRKGSMHIYMYLS